MNPKEPVWLNFKILLQLIISLKGLKKIDIFQHDNYKSKTKSKIKIPLNEPPGGILWEEIGENVGSIDAYILVIELQECIL